MRHGGPSLASLAVRNVAGVGARALSSSTRCLPRAVYPIIERQISAVACWSTLESTQHSGWRAPCVCWKATGLGLAADPRAWFYGR